jgi:RimJ/RimL family protein N-acetyltransferase
VATAVEQFQLAGFSPRYADSIAGWITNPRELRWLAPSTEPPLTPAKVVKWRQPGGRAFVYLRDPPDDPTLVGYTELNRMRSDAGGWWIGHFVIRPDFRGHGLGRAMLSALLDVAFRRLHARCVCLVVFPDNLGAIRCYTGVGFTCTGEEHHQFGARATKDCLLRYEISADAWRRRALRSDD